MTPSTNYARLTVWQARLVLAVIATFGVASICVTLTPIANKYVEVKHDTPGDVELYRATIERIRHGEGYYQAAATELPSRGFPTRSVFNWRTPLLAWLLGQLPSEAWPKALLGTLGLVLMLLTFEALAREEDHRRSADSGSTVNQERTDVRPAWRRLALPAACALLLSGPLLPTLGDSAVQPVYWASVLIAMSACAYGVERPALGVALGLAALFLRELAMPYVVVCVALAWWHDRRSELCAWGLGLMAWGLFFAFHAWQVSRWMPHDAQSHVQGWIQFGGAGLVIAAAQMNSYLLALPQWVTAIFLTAALVGFAGWSTPMGTRIGLTVCLFFVGLAVVGQRFNNYWGIVIAPLLCFGVVQFPASIQDLCRAAFSHRPEPSRP